MAQKMAARSLVLLLALLLASAAAAAAAALRPSRGSGDADAIRALPGWTGAVPFRQYSGYVGVGAAQRKQLHYWFVESQRDPKNDPLVLWMNGGPGCSSLLGLLQEHGPWRVNDDLSLSLNPYSWNLLSNVVYLEAPAGVGFSYSSNVSDYETNDYITARDNLDFLVGFFDKFPQFLANDLYIAGESYAGFYVPMLADLVDQHIRAHAAPAINFQGFLVGNGVANWTYDTNGGVLFAYQHALFAESTYDNLVAVCHGNFADPAAACQNAVRNAYKEMEGINPYNIIGPCEHDDYVAAAPRGFGAATPRERATRAGAAAAVGASPPCVSAAVQQKWLNSIDTKDALHVNTDVEWEICSNVLHYDVVVESVIPIYTRLMSSYRILVFSGDVDSVVPYTGTQSWINDLQLAVLDERRNWWYDDAVDGKQVGGQVKVWSGLVYATVRGAGHMVPQYRPAPALEMFRAFLHGDW